MILYNMKCEKFKKFLQSYNLQNQKIKSKKIKIVVKRIIETRKKHKKFQIKKRKKDTKITKVKQKQK